MALRFPENGAPQTQTNSSSDIPHRKLETSSLRRGSAGLARKAAIRFYRLRCGNPQKGPMFANLSGNPSSIDNLLHRQILPALDGCMTCNKQKTEHVLGDHEYKRNDSLP